MSLPEIAIASTSLMFSIVLIPVLFKAWGIKTPFNVTPKTSFALTALGLGVNTVAFNAMGLQWAAFTSFMTAGAWALIAFAPNQEISETSKPSAAQ